jgi:hypothetical protein
MSVRKYFSLLENLILKLVLFDNFRSILWLGISFFEKVKKTSLQISL